MIAAPAPATTPPRLGTLVLLTSISVVSLNLFLPSLAGMADSFGVSYAHMTWAISGYFAVTALMQLVLPPLSDRVGRRPVLLTGFSIFTLASILCAVAPTAGVFLLGRVLQSAVVTGLALSMAIVRDTSGATGAAQRMGQIGAAMALGPMVAPLIGGMLDQTFGWRANFALYSLLGAGALVMIWTDVGETAPGKGSSFAQQFAGYRILLTDAHFWSNVLTIAFGAGVFYVYLTTAPIVGQQAFGLSTAAVGLAMAATPVGYMLGNIGTTRLAARFKLTHLMIAGRLITLAGVVLALWLSLNTPQAIAFFGCAIAIGVGNGLTMPTGQTGAMSVRPELAGSAAGLIGAMTVGLGAISTSLSGTAIALTPTPTVMALCLLAGATLGLLAAIAADRTAPHLEPKAKPS